MTDRWEVIKRSAMRSIADDYENVEMILQETTKFAAERKTKVTSAEILEAPIPAK